MSRSLPVLFPRCPSRFLILLVQNARLLRARQSLGAEQQLCIRPGGRHRDQKQLLPSGTRAEGHLTLNSETKASKEGTWSPSTLRMVLYWDKRRVHCGVYL